MANEEGAKQYLRYCQLLVVDPSANNANNKRRQKGAVLLDPAIDLSQFRIKFAVMRSDSATPNTAEIRVYNLSDQTAIDVQSLVNIGNVVLSGGYDKNFGVIFEGNIKQVIIGRESGTDTFIDIIAGDGAQAYNYAFVSTSLAAGASQSDQVNAAIKAMESHGVAAGNLTGVESNSKLFRGKVLFGNARNYLRSAAQTAGSSWSIQDGKVNFVPNKSYLPGQQIMLTPTSGMVGTPYQTTDGVNVKCLLNPLINIGGRVYIDNSTILQQKLNLEQIAAARGDVKQINALTPRRLNVDGSYRVYVLEHLGDTRGTDWYTTVVGLNIDISANPLNSVQGSNV